MRARQRRWKLSHDFVPACRWRRKQSFSTWEGVGLEGCGESELENRKESFSNVFNNKPLEQHDDPSSPNLILPLETDLPAIPLP